MNVHLTRAADEQILRILDMRFNQGSKSPEICRRFGISNGKLQGIIHRTHKDKTPCACKKPENKDGGMPRRWWAKP